MGARINKDIPEMTVPAGAVLLVGAGLLQVPLIAEARALGLYTIATDGNPLAPGATVADEFHLLNTYDIPGHQRLARERVQGGTVCILGCCTAGADVAPTVAAAAEVAGTPGIPCLIAHRTHNKLKVRLTLSHHDLDHYQPYYTFADAQGLYPGLSVPYPCIVKPLEQRASRGVTIVHTPPELASAIRQTVPYGPECLIEAYLTGTEHSIEGIFDADGSLIWFNVVDRFFDYSTSIPIEIGHVNPSALVPRQQGAFKTMFVRVAKTLGVTWGPFKIDALMTPASEPKVLEVTARLSGGFDSQGTSPLTGRYPMRVMLQLACGLPITRQPLMQDIACYAACAAILPRRAGLVQALPYLDDAHVIWSIRENDVLSYPVTHNAERPGFAFAVDAHYEKAWEKAKSLANTMSYDLTLSTQTGGSV